VCVRWCLVGRSKGSAVSGRGIEMRNISSLFGGRWRGVVGLLALVMVAGSVVSAPLPASAACGEQWLWYGSGDLYKYSTTGTADVGTCDDINLRNWDDDDEYELEVQYHKGYSFPLGLHVWVVSPLGYRSSIENTLYTMGSLPDLVYIEDVPASTPYKLLSTQNGGFIAIYD